MKNVITLLVLVCVSFGYSQTNLDEETLNTPLKFKNLNISIIVNSADDIKSTLNVSAIEDVIVDIDNNETLSFAITCENTSKNSNSYLVYTVKGNTNDVDGFIKSVKKIKKSATKYYKNKA